MKELIIKLMYHIIIFIVLIMSFILINNNLNDGNVNIFTLLMLFIFGVVGAYFEIELWKFIKNKLK